MQAVLERGRLLLIDLQATYIGESALQANPGIVRSGGKATDVAPDDALDGRARLCLAGLRPGVRAVG